MSAIELHHGDCLDVLRGLPDCSVDSLVTDPPAGIAFMGADWDRDKGGRDAWIAWLADVMREVYRVLKPGAHGLVWALPRTSHWTATALEDAGFEIRDKIAHHFGSGFPKSHDVSKAIDRKAGAVREVVGTQTLTGNAAVSTKDKGGTYGVQVGTAPAKAVDITAPATDAARQWAGFGTALKPASEDWWLVRKPLAGTVAANVQSHGTGALNVDGCRVATGDTLSFGNRQIGDGVKYNPIAADRMTPGTQHTAGRWPANVVLSHSPECVHVGKRDVKASAPPGKPSVGKIKGEPSNVYGSSRPMGTTQYGTNSVETVAAYACAPGCPVAALDAQSGERPVSGAARNARPATAKNSGMFLGGQAGNGALHNDSGGASRFFNIFEPDAAPFIYAAKASTRERNKGVEKNTHPTVKSQALMRHLVRLVTPPGGIVLDPFAGSGSTLVACVAEGMRGIGIEREAEYVAIARARVAAANDNRAATEAAE